MIKLNHIQFALICAVSASLLTPSALANNPRSWVSNNGSDNNTCDISSPCRTYQHAHDVTVPGGELNTLNPGDYGKLTINRAITLDGANMGYIQLPLMQNQQNPAVIVDVLSNVRVQAIVIVRNLSIVGTPGAPIPCVGVAWRNGLALYVENVSINGVQTGISTSLPLVEGIKPQLFVTNAIIRNATLAGISIAGAIPNGNQKATNIAVVVDHTVIENVGSGVQVATGSVNITHSLISRASDFGVIAAANLGPCSINLADSSITYSKNAIGTFAVGGLVRIAGNNIHDNESAFVSFGGQIISFGNNRVLGNAAAESLNGAPVAMK